MDTVEKIMEVAAVILMATICVVVFVGVVFRYGFRAPLGWIEEIARYSLVWVTYIGSYLALRRAKHLSIDVFVKAAPSRVRKALDVVSRLVTLPLFIVMVFYGAYYAFRFMDQGTPYLELPLGYVYLILPVIGLLLVLEVCLQIVSIYRRG